MNGADRLLVVVCPALAAAAGTDDHALRTLRRVVDAIGTVCPWVDVVRTGVCALPARGPSRFFGGELAVAQVLRDSAAAVGQQALVGAADGLFAAHLAASGDTLVPPGGTAAFLAPWPITVLGDPELHELLPRLGLPTLGAFARLPERHVLARMGTSGVVHHRLARGVPGEPPGLRQPEVARRMAALVSGDHHDGPRQPGFWGERRDADRRAADVLRRLQRQLGDDAVQVVRRRAGRTPVDHQAVATWPGWAIPPRRPPASPWPGCLPPPAPVLVHEAARPVQLVDDLGAPVTVAASGTLHTTPRRLAPVGGPWTSVVAWSGPWPTWERWWTPTPRRQATVQVVTDEDVALLLAAQSDGWWLLATYD